MGLMGKLHVIKVAYKNIENKHLIFKKVLYALKNGGLVGLKNKILNVSNKAENTTAGTIDIYEMQQSEEKQEFNVNTKLTVVIDIKGLNVCIRGTLNSLKEQSYQKFNIAVMAPKGYQIPQQISKEIRTYYFDDNVRDVVNNVLAEAENEYLLFINGGNVLSPDALIYFAKEMENTGSDLAYCDECLFDGENGRKIKYFIKPDFSCYDLYNSLYIGQGVSFSKFALEKVGGFDEKLKTFSGRISDAVLKVASISSNITHIERVLLLRNSYTEEDIVLENSSIVKKSLQRMGFKLSVVPKQRSFSLHALEKNGKVSIIIPTDDYKKVLVCIEHILLNTQYAVYEIIIVSTNQICSKLQKYFAYADSIKYVTYEEEFNYSKKCNLGAKNAEGEFFVFLHDYIITEQKTWLCNMINCFVFSNVGGVSPKILRSDNTIRYAGIISGGFGFFSLPFNGEPNTLVESFSEPVFTNRQISVLSATCLAVRKSTFDKTDGFNEYETKEKFSNAAFSFEIQKQGLYCVYCSESEVYANGGNWYDSWFERESKTAYIYMLKNYGEFLSHDPYFTDSMRYVMLKNVPIDYKVFAKNSSKKSAKSVLLISHELSITGAPVALSYAAKALHDNGYYTSVLSPYDGRMREEISKEGISVIINSSINGGEFWLKFAENFDLIVVSTLVQYHSIIQLEKLNIPVMWWVHEAQDSYERGAKDLIPHTVSENVHIYCGGGYARRMMNKYRPKYQPKELLYYVPDYSTGIKKDYGYKLENIEGKFVFATIGTIEWRKGQDIFARAIKEMPYEYVKKCQFLFIGRNIDQDIYNKVIEVKELYPKNVSLIREVSRDEIRDIYNQCTAIVCASRDDPMPIFMTECLMLSKIAICSENTGTADLLIDGVNGFIYHNNDYKELMEKIKCVIDNEQKLTQIKIEGRRTYEKHFSVDVFNDNILKITNELLSGDS
ncbi:glycosyltransferase [Petroclostridium sp. X23]|uniref:glycosyltransferase n=1 Tax=Petroclostridium sp. X23 TaxID=3045146 RepID=UPI0024AC8C4D|nr:glycosyltransferase [Petroclostridium sp. X23]WHH57417.1 glycosyltransferase [Petroclostridium sp. X23]